MAGPASATSVIGKGSKTINHGYYYNTYKWVTYKYSSSKVKMVLTKDVYIDNSHYATVKFVTDILKRGNSQVEVVESIRYSNSKQRYKYWSFWEVKHGSPVRFYLSETCKRIYLKTYLT